MNVFQNTTLHVSVLEMAHDGARFTGDVDFMNAASLFIGAPLEVPNLTEPIAENAILNMQLETSGDKYDRQNNHQ